MTSKTSEIIKVSCGIGCSFEEAARAVTDAKKEKGRNHHNIRVYSGERLRSKLPESFKQRVREYRELAKVLSDDQKRILENFSLRDPVTGLLNKTGFVLRLEELKQKGICDGYYLLFDLDDLHDWNNKIGYTEVDKRIEAIGKVIMSNIRHQNLYPSNERIRDVVGHRLNESAGDEFLIFVPALHCGENLNEIMLMVERLIDRIYEIQLSLISQNP
jgi:GGDEF domain-containing protein